MRSAECGMKTDGRASSAVRHPPTAPATVPAVRGTMARRGLEDESTGRRDQAGGPMRRAGWTVRGLAAVLIAVLAASARGQEFARHVVVAQEGHASEIGRDVLRRGGNAVDAAVATAFALAVTHPAAGNLGGGGFIVAFLADRGEVVTVDFREVAPRA